jgi:cation:H+ antiporter
MATALRLARQGRGDATVSETMNSNTINLVGGIAIPTAILGVGTVAGSVQDELLWLSALTAGTVLALARPQGAGRAAGFLLVLAYLAFVVTIAFGG